ncbi:PTS sugar transporter subunit IIC [Lapidilactobacillus achengensis]|uniref:Permease IIC component n=1 Tax=Lapidilactobacillus achengensis TaxID=2486000 RepID=A0ABW1UR54_9LACO|nr:PTS sugar transporter subunit IIC [Lapidilactobacillus achengensis]
MSNFLKWVEDKLMPPMAKLSEVRYLRAIRDGIVSTMPLIMLGSLFCLIAQFPIAAWTKFIAPYVQMVMLPYRISVGLMAVYVAYGVGYYLAESYELDSLSGGILSMGTFLMSNLPVMASLTEKPKTALGFVLPMTYTGGSGMFIAILSAIMAVEIMRFCKNKNITIKMPEQVPESVSRSFAAIIPGGVSITIMWLITAVGNINLNKIIMDAFKPIMDLGMNSYLGVVIPTLLIALLWSAGVHGVSVIGSILRPFWLVLLQENMDAVAAGKVAPNIGVEGFYSFVWVGGAGGTLALCLLFMFTCKSSYLKQIGRLSFVPGLFNINEPIMFGAPTVLNPILAIPFIVGPFITSSLAWFALHFKLVNNASVIVPFTIPSPLKTYFMTNGDWRAIVLVTINFFIYLALYYPFVKVYDREMLKKESGEVEA